ncbi:hypothetical protein D3C78_1454650 [compost metagenome]
MQAHFQQVALEQFGAVFHALRGLEVGASKCQAASAHGRRASGGIHFFEQHHIDAGLRGFQCGRKACQAAADNQPFGFEVLAHVMLPAAQNGRVGKSRSPHADGPGKVVR